ncbi:MAG: methyltransferase domain-containing protein [Balneolaceae bacterium]|nr:methyltransferase domain-containing protein [Balneolaceae bacterium]
MKANSQQPSEASTDTKPGPEFVAQQLRKPSGDFAAEIGKKMDMVNKPLYDLTFEVMEFKKNDSVLEIGFGTGKFFDRLFEENNAIKVSGIDYSKEMVETAKENNQELISKRKLNIKLGNSEAIPFPDQSFDKVYCNMVVYFWDEPDVHLKEIRRVLKPEGTFYTGIRTRESMLAFPFVEFGFNLYSIKEWKEILNQNGFNIQETHKRSDPEIDNPEQDTKLRLQSCCIIADKPKDVN